MSRFQDMTDDKTARRRRALIGLVALASGVALAGCGDDAGDAASDPDPTTESGTALEDGATTPGQGMTVEIVGIQEGFEPSSTSVAVGSVITWVNADGSNHTATAEDGTWDSGNLDGGDEFAFTTDEAGTYDYVCTIHPSMTGQLIVE